MTRSCNFIGGCRTITKAAYFILKNKIKKKKNNSKTFLNRAYLCNFVIKLGGHTKPNRRTRLVIKTHIRNFTNLVLFLSSFLPVAGTALEEKARPTHKCLAIVSSCVLSFSLSYLSLHFNVFSLRISIHTCTEGKKKKKD